MNLQTFLVAGGSFVFGTREAVRPLTVNERPMYVVPVDSTTYDVVCAPARLTTRVMLHPLTLSFGEPPQDGVLAVNPLNLVLGSPPTTPAVNSDWSLSQLDALADHVGSPLGLATTSLPAPGSRSDSEAFARGAPAGHGLLTVDGARLRYAPSSLIAGIYRSAGFSRPIANSVALSAHEVPGVVVVRAPSFFDGAGDDAADEASWGLTPHPLDTRLGTPAAVASNFPFVRADALPTGRLIDFDPFLWGYRLDGNRVSRVYAKCTTHELAARMLLATGGAADPTRDLALKLQQQDEVMLDATVCFEAGPPDLDSWPEAIAAGFTPGEIAVQRFGNVTGAQLRSMLLTAKVRTVFVATPSASNQGLSGARRASIVGGRLVGANGAEVLKVDLDLLTLRPSFVVSDIDVPERSVAIRALENALDVSIFDARQGAPMHDWYSHTGLYSPHERWVRHVLTPQAMRALGTAVAFFALGSQTIRSHAEITQLI